MLPNNIWYYGFCFDQFGKLNLSVQDCECNSSIGHMIPEEKCHHSLHSKRKWNTFSSTLYNFAPVLLFVTRNVLLFTFCCTRNAMIIFLGNPFCSINIVVCSILCSIKRVFFFALFPQWLSTLLHSNILSHSSRLPNFAHSYAYN